MDLQQESLLKNLVQKFLTEKSGTDIIRQIAKNGRAGTRQALGGHGLSVQYARTEPRKYSFAVRTVEKWNNLPDDIKSAPQMGRSSGAKPGQTLSSMISIAGQGSKGEPAVK
jgi:hypothetical protein